MYPYLTTTRFWNKVNKDGPIHPAIGTECWLWTGYCMPFGHGQFNIGKHVIRLAHRFSWEIHFGEIPKSMSVCHHCDMPNCIRPDHLFLGTQKDNMQDANRKGRQYKGGSGDHAPEGENHWNSKLTPEIVYQIIQMRNEGMTYGAIAKHFNVHFNTPRDICTGRRWKHLPRP